MFPLFFPRYCPSVPLEPFAMSVLTSKLFTWALSITALFTIRLSVVKLSASSSILLSSVLYTFSILDLTSSITPNVTTGYRLWFVPSPM